MYVNISYANAYTENKQAQIYNENENTSIILFYIQNPHAAQPMRRIPC